MFGNRSGVFGGSFQSTRLIRARSPEFTLKVQEVPAEMRNSTWLPARELTLTETWSPDDTEFQVGDPITRTVTIHAKGLTGEQLPDLALPKNPHVKIYPDQATTTTNFDGSWAVGTREQKLALVPTQPGQVTIPEIHIRWWNLETHQPEDAVLPARTITILGAMSTLRGSPGPLGEEKIEQSRTTSPSSTTRVDSIFQKNNDNSVPSNPLIKDPLPVGLFCGLWVLTIIGWWYDRKNRHSHFNAPNKYDEEQTLRSLDAERESVRRASLANSPQQAREALLKWASVKWQSAHFRNLGSVAKNFQVRKEEVSHAQQAILELDRYLYAASSEEWDGKRFWEKISPEMKNLEKTKRTQSSKNYEGLAPLYISSSS